MKVNRRIFAIQSILGTAGFVAVDVTHAEASMLMESYPQASALGYRTDASKVDSSSFPKYVAGQKCGQCQLFRAREAGAAVGSCAIYPGKLVSAEGWCNAFVKQA
ncbi:high-potential iron-sulfur protein [Polaromonas jejuensis]|uniref:High-potential iron-sulfur protein n=1 Tax=Polaromonas jejuensis TaxID=457502 RepID=A0ABW0Q3F5_9BURK|nr:high-potential iron-sulfur protein [Polaromonas jejuensis]